MNFLINKSAETMEHRKHWQFCVGSGHALLVLRTDYAKQLKFIHDTLDIQRVRFHGIFHDDMNTYNDLSMHIPVRGAEQFAYDNVLATGMKPFAELPFVQKKITGRCYARVIFV